eukprot:4339780-Pleurochrysis_carterae.AAC.1
MKINAMLVNENQRLAYQLSPSRQAQEVLVCNLQSRHDDNMLKKRATKSKYKRTLRTECKKARCAQRVGSSTAYLIAPAAGAGSSSPPLSVPLARRDIV